MTLPLDADPPPQRTVVTGFRPFGGHATNPSAALAESCGRRFEVLEVAFDAVDEFLGRLATDAASFDQLVMLGLRGDGRTIDVERVARNHIGATPDVRGVVRGPGPIEPSAPDTLAMETLGPVPGTTASFSDDAGCYLCNYIYYRALRRFARKQVVFVHVPPFEVMPLDEQRYRVARIIAAAETTGAASNAPQVAVGNSDAVASRPADL